MTARLYKPTKTAMQSARGKTHEWVLEFEPTAARWADPLMGWSSTKDTQTQVTLRFATVEEGLAYCAKHGIAATVDTAHEPRPRPRAYADNFRYDRMR